MGAFRVYSSKVSTSAYVVFTRNGVIYDVSNLEVEERRNVAITVSPFPSIVSLPSGPASPGPDGQRCAFARSRERWTLQANCELSAALDLPAHVTLDGGGHTITLSGDAEGFESAAIRATGGDIFDLTVDGGDLLPLPPAYFAAITLAAPGRIAHTTVRNFQFGDAPHTAIGIEVAAFDGATAMVQDVTLENISGAGLLLTGNSQVSAERVSGTGVTTAIQVNGAITAQIAQAVVALADIGVLAQDKSRVRISDSDDTGKHVAEDRALIHQDTVTFIGAGDRGRASRRGTVVATPRDRLG